MFYVYRFINSENNNPVYVGFFTVDDFYYYNMADGITITQLPTSTAHYFDFTTNGSIVRCYYFDSLYKNKSDSGITLTYDSTYTVNMKFETFPESAIHVLVAYDLLPKKNGIGGGWSFEMPEAYLGMYNSEKTEGSTYKKYNYEYFGSFRDIDGIVHQLKGNGVFTRPEEGDCTYTSTVSSPSNKFLSATQYFATQTLGETGIQYNFTIYDSSRRLTYYLYNVAITPESIKPNHRMYVVAITDEYNNMIQYRHSDGFAYITQIIDTYGREINITEPNSGRVVSYTDENGVVQTIKYEIETLPATELNNDSPVVEKEVSRFKVTNQEGETTIYDSRHGEGLAYYRNMSVVPLYEKDCSGRDAIELLEGINVERIIYPNGGETRYKYQRIYTSNRTALTVHSSYAVAESYDIVNGIEKNKKTYSYEYVDSNLTKTETNSSSGLTTVSTYSTEGLLEEDIASATGKVSGDYIKNTYTYAEDNQLIYHYANNNGLTRIKKYDYSTNYPGMLMSLGEVRKGKTTYTYHTIDGKATLIPSKTDVYSYNGSKYVLDYSITTPLDSGNRAIEYTKTIKDNLIESQAQYAYDDYGRIISTTQWVGDTNGDNVLDSLDETVVTTTQYTENDYGAIAVTDTTDGVSTTYNYGVTGLPYSMTDPKGYTTQVEYDKIGRATKYIYPNGATETADYNVERMFTNVKDKAGEYTWTYFNQSGLPTSKHFSNSQWTQFETNDYDTSDRLTYKKSIYDVDKYTAERYTYDVLDRITSRQVYDNETLLYTENYTYGSIKTTKETTSEDGTAVASERETLDEHGRVVKKEIYTDDVTMSTLYTYDYRDNILTETDPMGNVTTYTYDIFNNITSITYPDGSQEHMYYDMLGRNTSVVDKNSVEYRNIYDKLGRVTETQVNVDGTYVTLTRNYYDKNSNITTKCTNINPQSNTGAMNFTYITYEYDNMNNLVGVSEDDGSDGRVTQYWYDTAGQMTKMATGLSGYYSDTALPDTARITQYGYDIHGNMTSRTDQLGNVTTYTYDYVGNVKTETHGNTTINKTYGPYGITSSTINGNSSYDDYTYTYNSIGMMNSHTSYYGTETIGYDAFGRKTSETSNGRTHLYSYDLNSRLTNYQMKNGTTIENDIDYTYDNMGRTTLMEVNDVTVNGSTITGTDIAYTYDTSGNLTSKVQGTNRTEITYNLYNQPIIYTNWVDNRALSSYEYTYNWKGNILSEIDEVRQYDKFYTYNAWDELVTEIYRYNGDVVRQTNYTYDRADNRTSKTVTGDENYTKTYTYNKKNQLLTETKTENDAVTEIYTYEYGTRGERTGEHITVDGVTNVIAYYTWDGNGRLFQHDTGFSHPAGVSCLAYFYDALGRRIKKIGGGDTIDFTWSGDNVMAETTVVGASTDRYVYGVDGITMNNTLYYFKNAHGDVTDVVDADGTTTGVYRYEAFGEKTASPTDDANPFQYCGEYTDPESRLIYLRNRYYDPEIGAFISEDNHWNVDNMLYGDEWKTIEYDNSYNVRNYADIDRQHKKATDAIPSSYVESEKNVKPSNRFRLKNLNVEMDTNLCILPDSNAIAQSGNLYIYAMNNPVKYMDSTGDVVSAVIATAPVWGPYVVAGTVAIVGGIIYYKEHSSNKTKSNLNKHQKGQARKQKDAGREKGDVRRTSRKDKRK